MMKQVKIKMPLRMLGLLFGLILSANALAQQIAVNGHVKDGAGEPIIGATVRIQGEQTATVTDFDGNFKINANTGATITVDYIGYEPFKGVAAPEMNITLKEAVAKGLNEVVVIGYGRAKKADVTGSVAAIKPDEMNHGLQTNAQDMIMGKIAGVNVISNDGTPGGGAQIRIRGGSSLNASNDPLIVIDGLAMDNYGVQGLANPLSMVNPNDIESFTVLKDASATAIYGSRASNGVIIITTKKGTTNSQTPQISYSGNVSLSTVKNLQTVLDGPQYMEFIKNLYGVGSDAYAQLGYLRTDGKRSYANTDWQSEIYRPAISTDHNVTMTGGFKRLNLPYRVSLGYTNNQGIVKTSSFERFTGSINLSPTLLNNHLKLNINAKGMIAKNRYADGGAIGASRYMDPTKPVTADNGIYQKFFGGYTQWFSTVNYDGDTDWIYSNNRNATSNPVSLLNLKNDRATSKSFIGNVEADYAIHGFEDLHLHINAGMDRSTGKQNTDISPYSVSNNYYGYTGWNKKDTYNMQLSMYAQYIKDLGDVHHFDVMAGYEWQHYHQQTNWNGYGLYPASNPVHPGTTVKGVWTPEKYNEPTTETRYESENYLVSFFGRLNYSLLGRYLLTFTLRDDGSSRFSKNNRWGLFPSAALAWRITDEPFMKNVKVINDFKLRLGWGMTGQQEGIGDYTYIPTYTPNLNHAYYPLFGDGTTYRPDAYNDNLTWEKTTTWNAGIDLAFLNDRLIFNLDYYYRKTTDLINSVYISAGSNFRNKLTSNIGSLHNTGFEFSTTVRPIQTKDWRWEINYNFTYNKNQIDELISGEGTNYYVETGGISSGTGGNIQAHHVGNAVSAFRVYQQVYDTAGKPIPNTYVDRNGNGIIDNGDRYYYYKPAPDVTMGFGSKLLYKNWDFGFIMRASIGNYVYNDNFAGATNVGTGAIYTKDYLTNRTPEAIALGFTNPLTEQVYSDYFVQNASFLKMDNITLGYTFSKLFGANISGRAYATVQNVFTITKYKGMDPEIPSGIDNNMYPRPLTSILGLTLNF